MAKLNILLVDDENFFLEVLKERMHSWDYDVTTASSGKEALEVFDKRKPDIVVLDYIMPDMDGIATLKAIRKKDRKVPVIMLTGHPDMKVIGGAEGLHISAFIPKMSAYTDVQTALQKAIHMLEEKINREGR